jgi:hypothetical protein
MEVLEASRAVAGRCCPGCGRSGIKLAVQEPGHGRSEGTSSQSCSLRRIVSSQQQYRAANSTQIRRCYPLSPPFHASRTANNVVELTQVESEGARTETDACRMSHADWLGLSALGIVPAQ